MKTIATPNMRSIATDNMRSIASTLITCFMSEADFAVESHDSPFFEHFHTLRIPIAALINPPEKGVIVISTEVDQGSYDKSAFASFIKSSGLSASKLQTHSHDVALTKDQLERIATGEKNVEIRVISKAGNYVHNFIVTAPRSVIVKVQKGRKQK